MALDSEGYWLGVVRYMEESQIFQGLWSPTVFILSAGLIKYWIIYW